MTDLTPNNKNLMATHDNSLVQASYRLNAAEQRLLIYAAAVLRNQPDGKDTVRLNVREFLDEHGLQTHSPQKLFESVQSLFNRVIHYRSIYKGDTGKNRQAVIQFRWISGLSWNKSLDDENDNGYMTLRFTPEVKNLITELTDNFTKIEIKHIKSLTSSHAMRLYTIFNQWLQNGSVTFEIDEFRRRLDLQDKYPSLDLLKRWVINPSLKQINERTDLFVQLTDQRKVGRKILSMTFRVRTQASVNAEKQKEASDIARERSMIEVRQMLPQSEHLKTT
jgi:plasmid replication initiation protein